MDGFSKLTLFFIPFVITLIVTLVLKPISHHIGLVDKPCSRKQHSGEIPLIGGIAIYIGLLLSVIVVDLNESNIREFYVLISSLTLLVMLGLVDDKYKLGIRVRFFVQVIAVLTLAYGFNAEIVALGNILGFGIINLGVVSVFFTVFAFVGGINAFNMLDGLDGLAGGLCLMYLLLLTGIFGLYGDVKMVELSMVLSGSVLAFLLFNLRFPGRKHALIFLGDTGSMLLGFLIIWLLIYSSQDLKAINPVTVLWILAIPLFDSVGIMLRRFRKGQSPFRADRGHFHHILLDAGYSVNHIVITIIILSVSFSLFGLTCQVLKIPEWVMFYGFLACFAFYYFAVSKAWLFMMNARQVHVPLARDRLIIILPRNEVDRRITSDRRVREVSWDQPERRVQSDRRIGIDRRITSDRRVREVSWDQPERRVQSDRRIGIDRRKAVNLGFVKHDRKLSA